MGIDYDATLAVGFTLTTEDLERPFKQRLPEASHVETRYDEITGEPYEKKVVDREADEYVVWDGEDYTGDPLRLVEDVVGELQTRCGFDLQYEIGGSYYEACFEFVVGPQFKWDEGDLDPDQLHDIQFRKAKLAWAMREMGYEPGSFRVRALLRVS